jgi:uncharacterized membrane protein
MRMTKLFMIAVVGTLIAYTLVDLFILDMPFWKFWLIEMLITASHAYYNYAKKKIIVINPN